MSIYKSDKSCREYRAKMYKSVKTYRNNGEKEWDRNKTGCFRESELLF